MRLKEHREDWFSTLFCLFLRKDNIGLFIDNKDEAEKKTNNARVKGENCWSNDG